MLFETFEDSATAPLHVAAESVDVVPARLVYPANLCLNVGDVLPARFRQLIFVLLEAPVPPTAAAWHGGVAVGEVDGRLCGPESVLHVFQVTEGSGVLVCLGSCNRTRQRSAGAGPRRTTCGHWRVWR